MVKRTGTRQRTGLRGDLGGAGLARKWWEAKESDTLLSGDGRLPRFGSGKRGRTSSMARSLAFMAASGTITFVTAYGKCEYPWAGAARVLVGLSGRDLPGVANSIIRTFFNTAKRGSQKIYCSKKQKDCLLDVLSRRIKADGQGQTTGDFQY